MSNEDFSGKPQEIISFGDLNERDPIFRAINEFTNSNLSALEALTPQVDALQYFYYYMANNALRLLELHHDLQGTKVIAAEMLKSGLLSPEIGARIEHEVNKLIAKRESFNPPTQQ